MPDAYPKVVCFGEILWDFLPGGTFPGGAPFNVAYHLHQLRTAPYLASAVGCDALGDELLRRVREWGLGVEGIARHADLPTGTVHARLSAAGDARYEIATNVAWDHIVPSAENLRAAANANAFVFGSLAQRSPFNQTALDQLLGVLPADAHRVFDVNLRPPHDDLALVRRLAAKATVLKLNADESARLTGLAPGREEAHARALADSLACPFVIITAGARGAGLLREGRWYWETARPVVVADTVGAGDAFLAALVAQLVVGKKSDGDMFAGACRLGEWVAAQRGATPTYTASTPAPI